MLFLIRFCDDDGESKVKLSTEQTGQQDSTVIRLTAVTVASATPVIVSTAVSLPP